MTYLLVVWKKRLITYFVFLSISFCILLTVGWRYPIEQETAQGALENSLYEYHLELPTHSDQVADTTALLAPGRVLLGAYVDGPLSAKDSGKVAHAEMVITGTPQNADLSLLPDAMRVSGNRTNSEGAWIDMSHMLAHSLGVRVGDKVTLPYPVEAEPIELTVRGTYAVTGLDGQSLALVSAPELAQHFSSTKAEQDYFYAWTQGISREDIETVAGSQPFADRLSEGGVSASSWLLESKAERLEQVAEYSKYRLGLVRILAVVSIGLAVALLVREALAARSRLGLISPELSERGIPRVVQRRHAYTLYAITGMLAAVVGGVGAYLATSGVFTGAILPPTLRTDWVTSVVLLALMPYLFFLILFRKPKSSRIAEPNAMNQGVNSVECSLER